MLSAPPHASSRFSNEDREFKSYSLFLELISFSKSAALVICLKVVKKGGGLGQGNRAGELADDRMLHAVSYHLKRPTIASNWTSISTELRISGIDLSTSASYKWHVYIMLFITYSFSQWAEEKKKVRSRKEVNFHNLHNPRILNIQSPTLFC